MAYQDDAEGRLVGALHRAALDPAQWRDFLLQLEAELSGTRSSICGIDSHVGGVFTSVGGDFDPGFGKTYLDYYHSLNPFLAGMPVTPLGGTRFSAVDLPDDALLRTEFYNDWLRPQDDLFGGIGLRSGAQGGRSLFLALNIPRRARDSLNQPVLDLLHRLEPHFTHAFRVAETLAELALRAAAGPQDDAAGGILVTDRNRMLVWAEPRVMALHGQLFRLDRSGRLIFSDPKAQDWAIAVTAQGHRPPAPDFRLVSRAESWTIRALPHLQGMRASPLFPGAFLHETWPEQQLAFVLKREAQVETPQRRLMRLHQLTLAEAEVALLIAQGGSTAEIAQGRQASVHTVRNQIRAVLSKMEARHRGDITRLALTGAGDAP